MGQRHADLGKPLPQVAFLCRSGFPSRPEDLVSGEGPATGDEIACLGKCLLRRQWLFRDWFDTRSAIRQRSTQRIAWPRLARPALGVPVTSRRVIPQALSNDEANGPLPSAREVGLSSEMSARVPADRSPLRRDTAGDGFR